MQNPDAELPPNPSTLAFESVSTRRRIIASYWLIVILSIPLWWKTTSIDRLALPSSRVRSLEGKELKFPVHVNVASEVAEYSEAVLKKEFTEWMHEHAEIQGLQIEFDSVDTTGPGSYYINIREHATKALVHGRHLSIGTSNENEEASKSLIPLGIADTLWKLLLPSASQTSSEAHRIVKYSPRIRLAFTLLNEDAAAGVAAFSWDVQEAIRQYLGPSLDRFSILHNFTVESQVQFHAPLAFKPRTISVDGIEGHGLTPEELTVFVNSAEWTLSSSVSNDPVLHFVLFVPSTNNPLYILDHDGSPTSSNAFLLPQWGGIVLLNRGSPHLSTHLLHSPFATFQQQLLSLLGVPNLPPSVNSNGSEPFTDWQLDALVRQRARENAANAKETLQSITALVHQIENMPVGQDVKGDVQNALGALDSVFLVAKSSSTLALQYSSEALSLASRAFFNPGMLALLYFPAEHKYAVYTPLFASVAAPLMAAVIRELMAWKKARKAAAAKRESVDKVKAD